MQGPPRTAIDGRLTLEFLARKHRESEERFEEKGYGEESFALALSYVAATYDRSVEEVIDAVHFAEPEASHAATLGIL